MCPGARRWSLLLISCEGERVPGAAYGARSFALLFFLMRLPFWFFFFLNLLEGSLYRLACEEWKDDLFVTAPLLAKWDDRAEGDA
jgi:hypothetical protein